MATRRYLSPFAAALILSALTWSFPMNAQADAPPAFAAFEQWKTALASGDPAALRALYSSDPAATISTRAGQITADEEINFWSAAGKDVKFEIVQSMSPKPGIQQVVFQAQYRSATAGKTFYVTEGQVWQQQGGQWRQLLAKRTEAQRLQQPATTKKDIYPAGADAKAEIRQAESKATKEGKRVLLVFGANWCYDCHVLDLAFQRPELAPVLAKNYEVVHVDVGQGDKNQDVMEQYGVPMSKGIPGLAVLASDGKLLFSQKNGEFEKARDLTPEALLDFLNQWKGTVR
jgi:hypothetical protein